jgi:hypothetical protein
MPLESRTIYKTTTTPLFNAKGKHVVTQVDTFSVEQREAPQPLPAPARTGRTVWQELCDAAKAYCARYMQAAPPVAPGAYWPNVPPAPDTLGEASKRRQAQG